MKGYAIIYLFNLSKDDTSSDMKTWVQENMAGKSFRTQRYMN